VLRKFQWVLAAAIVFAGVVSGFSPARAQGDIITDIRVEGNQRIETATVISYMVLRPGDPFDPQRMDRSLKSLFATGLFSDVNLRREVTILVVRVVENPVINRISFEGNNKLDDDQLAAEVQLRPRVVYTRTKVQNDVRRILELYRRSGRFGATVEPKAITLEQNRVDLVFEINEGETTGIERIAFIGNTAFSDGELRDAIVTTESVWWNFLTSNDTYDPDRLTFDRELLRRFYLSEGYADFRILSAVAELTPDRSAFYVTFTLDEGERYRFGAVAVESSIKNLTGEELVGVLTFEEGEWYDADEIDESINALTDRVGVLGFAFVEIRPDVRRNPEILTLDVTFIIQEGPKVYVERINIVGNTRTLDFVVRREMLLIEGDPFNTSKVQLSRRRLQNLNFFESIEIENMPGSAPDKTILEVSITEQPTGELSLGAGFSTDEGPLATVGVSERNFLGQGQSLRAAFSISGRSQQIDFSYTEPYFLGYNMSAGVDIFRITTDVNNNDTFSQESTGGAIRLGYEITQHLKQSLRLSGRNDKITDVAADAPVIIADQEGETLTVLIGQELLYDRRDSVQQTKEGYFVSLGTDFAGLGGDAEFIRVEVAGGVVIPIWDDWRLVLSGEAGAITGINGDEVRIQHRFFKGGTNLRGFAVSGVGPRDIPSDDPVGGNYFATGTVEMSFPLGLPESLGVEGKIFTDFGTVTGLDQSSPDVVDTGSLRASVGIGLQINTPFGPVRVDLAQAVLKESFDETQLIHFSFGTTF